MRCRRCGLVYVGHRATDFTFRHADPERSSALAQRVAELEIVHHDVEEGERPLRLEADRERLERLRRHIDGGALLDVGCATGTFLHVAREAFEVTGVEPDPGTSEQARAAGLNVLTGTPEDLGPSQGPFQAVTMFHVLEHLDSPRRTLTQVHELLAPEGLVMIETPTIDCLWFRFAPRRWRQLIPDHYYFYSRRTLEDVLRRAGLEPVAYEKVARRVSVRFLADRMRRSGLPPQLSRGMASLARASGFEERTVRVNPGDIMSVIARARAR